MKAFHNKDGKPVLMRMVSGIKENKDYLGEIDGLIGDGDHGMNMNKGFSLFQQRFEKETFDLSEGLRELGMILLNEIGGSMGPIYGTVFMAMADEADGKSTLNGQKSLPPSSLQRGPKKPLSSVRQLFWP